MAKLFGQIEEADIADLPKAVQDAIKAGSASADETTALKTRLTELETKMAGPKKGPNGEELNEDGTPKVAAAATQTWNPAVTPHEEMLYDTRCDNLLMQLERDQDQTIAACVKLFRKDIDSNLKISHPANRGNREYVLNIVNLVKGRNMGAILNDINKKEGKFNSFYTESTSNGGTVQQTVVKVDPVTTMTAEEKKAADMYGIPYEKYAAVLAEGREKGF